jgi:hypothetical protein
VEKIGVVHTDPDEDGYYQFDFSTLALIPTWNQINVEAYDTAGNKAPSEGTMHIFLYYTPPDYLIYLPLVRR